MPVSTLADPDPSTARDRASDALAAGDVVTLVGRCTVEYEGRTEGYLGAGDRLVVYKPDGTLLVHTDAGRTPVVWHPPGGDHAFSVESGTLRATSRRERPAETTRVDFSTVAQFSALSLADDRELELSGSEADLRERVLDDPALVEPGFRPLATERETAAGPVDVYGEDADGNAVALELKRRRAGPDAVSQLGRYVEALASDLHADATVRGVLVAPSLTERASELLAERGLEFVPLSP